MSIKIVDVEAIWLRIPDFESPCEWGEDAFIVRVHTDSGIVGIGESDSAPAVLKAMVEMPSSHSTCRGLRDVLIGENPLEIARLWKKMYDETAYMGRRGAGIHAISAIDIALWDIASQHYRTPIATLLGGKRRKSIDAYGTFIPRETMEGNRTEIETLRELGLRAFKIGGGSFGLDADRDVETVKAIRGIAGADMGIAIDLVGCWRNYEHAARQIERMSPYSLSWVEEPLPSDAHLELRRLAEKSDVCITGGEGLTTAAEFEEFVRESRPGIVQPDITRCGGITEARRISDVARRHGARLVPHGFSTGILLAATVQFLASEDTGDLIEYSRSTSPLITDLVTNVIPLVDGRVNVPDVVGLGVDLDEDLIRRYRVDMNFGR